MSVTYYSRELGRVLTPQEAKPIAVFRKKGCKTCKPIPVFAKPANSLEQPIHSY